MSPKKLLLIAICAAGAHFPASPALITMAFTDDQKQFFKAFCANPTHVLGCNVKIASKRAQGKYYLDLIVAGADGNATKTVLVDGDLVMRLSHLGPYGKYHDEAKGIQGDSNPQYGCSDFSRASAMVYVEQSSTGPWVQFAEKVQIKLREFFLNKDNMNVTQQFFPALAKLQKNDEDYTKEKGLAWAKNYEEMMGETFVNLPAKVREYNGRDYASITATTNLVGKPYKNQTEEDCLKSWPEKIGDYTPEELGISEPKSTMWRPHEMRDMYGSKVDSMKLYHAKYTHDLSKLPVGVSLYVRGITYKDGRFSITSYLNSVNFAIDKADFDNAELLTKLKEAPTSRQDSDTFFVKRKRGNEEEETPKKPRKEEEESAAGDTEPEEEEPIEPF